MEAVFLYTIIISGSISALLAGAKIYNTFFNKDKRNREAQEDARIVEMYYDKAGSTTTPTKASKSKTTKEPKSSSVAEVVTKKKTVPKKNS
jgi:hypothetical protein